MKVVTQNPVLVGDNDIYNGYTPDNDNNLDLKNSQQDINLGDISVRSSYPVIVDGKDISQNEFLYTIPSEIDGIDLTPTDEFLWAGFNGPTSGTNFKSTGLPANFGAGLTEKEYTEALKDVPNGPTAKQQKEKIKEGQFWNNLRGGWDKFKKTDSGQILIQSGVSYLQSKLDEKNQAAQQSQMPTATPEAPIQPMSKGMKIALIVGGVAVLGAIVYYITKTKK